MTTVAWSEFDIYVRPEVPKCPALLVREAVRQAAIEFCRFTGIWEEDCLSLTTAANVQTYQIAVPNAAIASPVEITSLKVDDVPKSPATKPFLDQNYPTWKTDTGSSVLYYTQSDNASFDLIWKPDSSGTAGNLKVRASLKPLRDATTTDEKLLEEWYEPICWNAKYRLMSMANEAWANPKRAEQCYREWKRGRDNFFWKAQQNQGANMVATSPMKFGVR